MNTGSVIAQFTVTLTHAVTEPVLVEWFTSDGTAVAGIDYAENRGTVTFAPGQTERNVEILVYGRPIDSPDVTFFVNMLPPLNAILGAPIGEVIIHVDTSGTIPVAQIIVATGPVGQKGDKGDKGDTGDSAYEAWLALGNTGTEQDFIDSLSDNTFDRVADAIAAFDGALTGTAAETPVPAHSDPDLGTALNAQAQALLNRLEYLKGENGAGRIGFGNTTIERVLDSEIFIDYSDDILDYGPIINAAQQSGSLGGIIRLRDERYPVLTTITRRAGWKIAGVGPYATELAWGGGNEPMIKNEQVSLLSRGGIVIGNNSGQYHTSLEDLSLIGNGLGIGLLRGEGWWDRMVRVIIGWFDIGQQDGLGSSNVTGCYWCRNEQVWYRNNRVNLRVTDYSNLNTWANCRFSGAGDWDVEFIEPSNSLTLGQQGIRFEDCEILSPDAVYLGSRIFDLNFHNVYFEQSGYAVYDGTAHSKGSVTFTGTTKVFGSQSTKNKIVAGYNGGNCQNWSFQNLKTNLGKGAGAPATMQVIDMGPTANYFSAIHPVLTGVAGWELTQPENLSKLKMQLLDVNGKSILQMASLSTARSLANAHHTVVDYTLTSNIGVDLFEKGVDVGELTTAWFTVMEVPDFAVSFAHAAFHYELTIGGRNPASNNVKAAFVGGEAYGVNGVVGGFVEVFNRQSGSAQITVEHQIVQSGGSLLVQIRKSAASTAVFDQVYCAVESKTVGKFTELAI